MLGRAHHFRIYAPEKVSYAVDRYTNEARRLYGVMNRRLAKVRYMAGADYSFADIAIFPWLRSWKNQGIDWNEFSHLLSWRACASRWSTTRLARRCSARGNTSSAALACGATTGVQPRILPSSSCP
jgi:glutathione S-transferase